MQYHDLRFGDVAPDERTRWIAQTVSGTVYVIREALQAFDLLDAMIDPTLRGVARTVGPEAAERAQREGWHRIHEFVSPADIPRITDAVYEEIEPVAQQFLKRFIGCAFPGAPELYYEQKPNVRFHIPYDLAAPYKQVYKEFAARHGEGKIGAHGPHRDSWLDCPDNGVNLWFALGRVQQGNGLTVYADDYQRDFKYQRSGDIADGERLHKPLTVALAPGDLIMFHTDQVHGSELNRTDETRFAISYRLSFEKPHFPNGHYHDYVHRGLSDSPLKPLAHVPAMLQPSYARSLVERARNRFLPQLVPAKPTPNPPEEIGELKGDRIEVPLHDVPVGRVRGLPKGVCVARIGEREVVALSRRCPHQGGDMANGWVEGDQVVCPWHALPFDKRSGESPCRTLKPLKRLHCEVTDDVIVVYPNDVLNASGASAAE